MKLTRLLACLIAALLTNTYAHALSTSEVTAIAKKAFIWGYPIVDNYSVLYEQALDPNSPAYRAPLNQISHANNTATPQDKSIVAPNVDTPYSYAWLDLKNEPVILTIPRVEKGRYVAIQLIDAYTYIIDYIKPNPNNKASYLIAGPNWTGKIPRGIRKVIRADSNIVLALYRTELFYSKDIDTVRELQKQYLVQTLASYQSQPALAKPILPPLVRPVDIRKDPTNLEFFTALNWMLSSMPVLPQERNLRNEFAQIGIKPGAVFNPKSQEEKAAITAGMQAGLQEMVARSSKVKSSVELFGSRAFLGNDYLTRAVAAMIGIYGNAAQEFMGVGYPSDSNGQPFNGQNNYQIHIKKGQLPPVDGFWSITAYGSDRFLYENQLDRYKLSSHMLPQFIRNSDGSITFYIQHASPGKENEANWLPIPDGPFLLTFRTYLPKEPIRNGQWRAPPVILNNSQN
ncbi:DUF1254 domain-containing protein [Polynucleobacter sp. 71A-WALBACH]|uniref:DUF1254 domain-containing protein n=1 Tax=Polynucleobacter sp. 71A-WALBACH TaxID=2689097 RepID=UPI001C0CF463|nr:DUF1254 domain-containing protein [Polynucleobacter sp. 71A-WALBACH]MBU3594534.1 DUF1254 domain-containing protein [Polynucleobacter sp. 71A-WALBACH]